MVPIQSVTKFTQQCQQNLVSNVKPYSKSLLSILTLKLIFLDNYGGIIIIRGHLYDTQILHIKVKCNLSFVQILPCYENISFFSAL